ncbi:MAG: SDR family oxidoreductase [Pseudomonadota bacterium]
MLLSQLAAKHMVENHIEGNIINISSISGIRSHPNRVAHGTAKAALNMLTKNMALELAPHKIRVNAILPGGVPYATDPETAALVANDPSTPLQRAGKPEDQAKMALFLASQDSEWLTGQLLTVDGGQTLT